MNILLQQYYIGSIIIINLMQELSTISTKEHSSEIAKREVKGLTMDPFQETLYTVEQYTGRGSGNVIVGYTQKALQGEAVSVKIEGDKSSDHEVLILEGLAANRAVIRAVQSEANPQGEPRHLSHEVSVDPSTIKQGSSASTYAEPDCLRFCPSNSSAQVDISLSGLTARAKASMQTARANKAFSEGVHYWEVICPISCSTLQIGISNKSQTTEIFQQFRTSTPRIVGIELNLVKLTMNFWLNGRHLKDRNKKVTEGHSWVPTIKFKEPDYFVVLNPFGQGHGHVYDETNTNYLPNTLKTSELQTCQAYLETQLKGLILAYSLSQPDKADEWEKSVEKQLKLEGDHQYQVKQIVFADHSTLSKEVSPIAFIQFSSEQEAVRYYHNSTELKLLYPKQVAKLLLLKEDKDKVNIGLPSHLEKPVSIQGLAMDLLFGRILPEEQQANFKRYGGLAQSKGINQVGNQISQLQRSLENGTQEITPTKAHDKQQDETQITYLQNSDKLLLANGSELKLIHRHNGQFELQEHAHFTLYPQDPHDLIRLRISREDLLFVLRHLQWSWIKELNLDVLSSFLEAMQNQYDSLAVCAPYIVALGAVRSLLNVGIAQYEQLEESLHQVEEREVVYGINAPPRKEQPKPFDNSIKLEFESASLSAVDAHQLLSVLFDLEDQLWAGIQDDQVPSSVKDLWPPTTSRLVTAYGRLSSLITFPQSLDPLSQVDSLTLAELGIYNAQDKYGKLEMFQEFRVNLESVFESQRSERNELQAALEKQLPNNLMVKGFPTWNVPLSRTLNSFPPSLHENQLSHSKKQLVRPADKISVIKQLEGSDFVLTGSREGSVGVWNSRLRLHCVGGVNYKSKLYQEDWSKELEQSTSMLKQLQFFSQQPPPNQHSASATEEEKKQEVGGVKILLKKHKIMSKAANTEALEDILFTMFDEQEEVADSDGGDYTSDEDGDGQGELLLDYNDSPAKTAAATKPPAEETKEEVKEADTSNAGSRKTSEVEIAQPTEELLNQLVLMGFPLVLSKAALIKVKNESITAAIEAIVELQAQEELKKPKGISEAKGAKTVIQSWSCGICTYINTGGNATCEMCTQAAPATAYIEVKSEDDISKEKEILEKERLEEEERLVRQQEQLLKQQAEKERKLQQEELTKKQMQALKEQTVSYYQNSEIVDFFFAQYKGGKDSKPLLCAAVFHSTQLKRCDIQFVRFSYSPAYLRQFIGSPQHPKCQVCDIPFPSASKTLEHVFTYHSVLVESYYPIFVQNQLISKKWSSKTSKHSYKPLRAEEYGTAIWPFETIQAVCQIGDNIAADRSLFIIGVGKKHNETSQTVIMARIDSNDGLEADNLNITTVSENSSLFKDIGIEGAEIKKIFYSSDHPMGQLLVETNDNQLFVAEVSTSEGRLALSNVQCQALKEEEQILRVERGIAYIQSSGHQEIRRLVISRKLKDGLADQRSLATTSLGEGVLLQQPLVEEAEVLKMRINPDSVTIQDIVRYEKLMNGRAIGAQSNAHICQSAVYHQQKQQGSVNFTKHHWVVDHKSEIRPLEMQFEHPTSLISLNVELVFNCTDTSALIAQLQSSTKSQDESRTVAQAVETSSTKAVEAAPQSLNLGMLSIQSSNDSSSYQGPNEQNSQRVSDYLPLTVPFHKGSCYNQSYQVCRLIMDNNLVFASNYPRPEFYLKHQNDHKMTIEKIVVRSQPSSKCGAYPIGSGIIFMADHLSAFELTTPFHKFSKADYDAWKQERVKDPSPHRPYEPVAYFEMDTDIQTQVEPDFKKPCRYIFLKPTGFRKKPIVFSQAIHSVPMEIEFFGVTGTSWDDEGQQKGTDSEEQLLSVLGNIDSQHSLELRVLNQPQALKTISAVEIETIQGFDISFSAESLMRNASDLNSLCLVGKTQLKITDSHLQLQSIQGLSMGIKSQASGLWQLRGVSVLGVVADQDFGQAQYKHALFQKPEIHTSYMRSCLLSPKFFSVVNKVLAQIASSEKHDYALRLTILTFLTKILKVDRDFVPLVLAEIDLKNFIKINVFNSDSAGISFVLEFLQNFQRDPKFCRDLFDILIEHVKIIPHTAISYHGYEAFIGMLKWAMPINPEVTLLTLLETLYQSICLDKVTNLQSKEYINFRSRFSFNTFPFDLFIFRAPKHSLTTSAKDAALKQGLPQSSLQRGTLLPALEIKKTKHDYYHIYDVQFENEVIVQDLKLYLGSLEQAQYKLTIKVFSSERLAYFCTLDENYFSHLAYLPYARPQGQSKSDQADDALLIQRLQVRGKELKVVIQFGISNSSMPKPVGKTKPPETLIEIYGSSTDQSATHSTLKDLLDKKAKTFWQNGAKLFQVGRSQKMLQIVTNSSESLLTPQGYSQHEESAEGLKQQEELKANNEVAQASQTSSKLSELELLQEELKGKISANDPNIQEIVEKISAIQTSLSQGPQEGDDSRIVNSLEYYLQIASDFTKLIRTVIKTQKMHREKLVDIFRGVEASQSLTALAFELFKRFVVFDSGQVKADVLNFIIECLQPLMTSDEKKAFAFRAIEEFLSTVHNTFSQKAVLESLNAIGIPEGELISFLTKKLNIVGSSVSPLKAELGKVQPFILMSTVLILALHSMKQINIPEPGQVIHKGIGCSSCHSKLIVGWRYKCGHCIGDVNLDEKCVAKHLAEHPSHIMLIIQEQLPYNSKSFKQSKSKQNKPILPPFEFKEDDNQGVLKHDDFNCENCGLKPILGNCYRCVNCEDYSLCEKCYTENLQDHFSYHIFAKLHRVLKHSEKNPTSLLQVLDPRLYPHSNEEKAGKPPKKEELQDIDEEEFEDLAPLSMSRSMSVPMPHPLSKKLPSKGPALDSQYQRLDIDEQFVVLFQMSVWICQDPLRSFSKEEKIVLLKLTIETMLQVIKLTSVKHIYQVVSDKQAFFHLLISILHLNSKDLIALYKSLLECFRQPPSLQRKIKEDQQKSEKGKAAAKSSDKKQQLDSELAIMKELLGSMISHVQHFLKWLVDIGLSPDIARLQIPQSQDAHNLFSMNYASQHVWLEHLSFILELFIRSTDKLKEVTKAPAKNPLLGTSNQLEKIPEEAVDAENDKPEKDAELPPLNIGRSISMPVTKGQTSSQIQQSSSASLQLIKSLVQLLYINDSAAGLGATPVKSKQHKQQTFDEYESATKYLSQMWSLVLKSLTTVSINQLIEARIFDSLVSAFLISTEEIKQITFPQILSITETIAQQSIHANDISKFIGNLLFTTLENVTDNHHEKVGYSICQGWLDILISSSIARSQDHEKNKTVFAKMSAEEVSVFLRKTAHYLTTYLNKGSFEGVTGANTQIVMRLNLASDLMFVIRFAESKTRPGTSALQELFTVCETNTRLRRELQESMDYVLAWLFLNARQQRDEVAMSQLGNSSAWTPATAEVKKITDLVEDILTSVGDNENNEQAIRIALLSLTAIVKKMNQTVLDLAQDNSLGYDTAIKLSERTNEYFIKLLGSWLVSDSVASYFVFDLSGFEFLLDTIGVGSDSKSTVKHLADGVEFELIDSVEEQKSSEKATISKQLLHSSDLSAFSSLMGSDLAQYLESSLQEFQAQTQPVKPANDAVAKTDDKVQEGILEKPSQLALQEYGKVLAMVSNNGGDPISSYAKTDWSVNKRAYKHRIIIKHLTGQLRSEYWILFQLPSPVEIKEIQIGFNNYWAADTEVYAEPLSVLVEAGMDENNLSLVCSLQIVKDDAFGSVSATVFGKNLQTFAVSASDFSARSIEDIIQSKLQSLQNFKIQYIKFYMRRQIFTCLENSALSIKFTKQPALAINYISLIGYDLSKVGEYVSYVKQEQKKTALEVLSIICSGDFSNILKVIANQKQTIDKIKKSFNLLASLVQIKKSLIEPTFIAISTYNTEMGDWIINQFLKSGRIYNHASLVGEIIMCHKSELPRRLNILQDHVMNQLSLVSHAERSTHGTLIKKLLPFIQIFIQTLRISAPEQGEAASDLRVQETQLLNIVNLMSAATQEREQQTRVLTQLLVLLMCPPKPFTNHEVNVYDFTMQHLIMEKELSENNELERQRETLASILSVAQRKIALTILERGIKLNDILNPGRSSQSTEGSQENAHLQHCLKFWIHVAHDEQVKAALIEQGVPIKLYQTLRSENPEKSNSIIRSDSIVGDAEMLLIIELIKILTAGFPRVEAELALSLKNDLEHLSKIRDMNFVNQVFLQLLRVESTIPVCLWPYDSQNQKWLPTYKPWLLADSSQSQVSSNNFVASSILQGESRSTFIKNFKEIVGQHQKGSVKKLLSSNWVLSHSQTEQGQVSQFSNFWKNIENKQPVIILMQCTLSNGQNAVFGCYNSKGIPGMPANLAQDSDYVVTSNPEDFCFCYIDESSFHHFQPKSGVPIVAMYTDYEGGGAISVAHDFMLMSFSYDFQFTVGVVSELDKVQESSNPKPEKPVTDAGAVFQRFEVWTPSTQSSSQAQVTIHKSKLQTLSQLSKASGAPQAEDSSAQAEFKHPWYNELSPYVNFRTNPVFMVPAHLSLSQLSKILLESNVSFKPRFSSQHLLSSESLLDLHKSFTADQNTSEQYNGVIDLEYEVNQLLSIQSEEQREKGTAATEEEQAADGSQMVQGYVPQMGLFEQFESQGGVKSIISVTLASLKLWKAEEQSQSWELWLKELESFSEIPLFFQLFLKNTRCKDLLFKVLAGLPDTEISAEAGKADGAAKARWEEEQKSAVQFNYKILSDAFQISNDLKLRDIALECGLLPRILERLSAISGEKPRQLVDESAKEEEVQKEESKEGKQLQQLEKNVDKKKRKGVGYSSKVGQTFNVTAYLENKKQRNEQIKNLIDICTNFLNCKEWKANDQVLSIILESALLPLLEAAFRNGSWLEMAKENEVYHSYLALTRALASQRNLISTLVEIDERYKPAQTDPLYKLLQKLNDLADIFLNCLNQQAKAEQRKSQTPSLKLQTFQQKHQDVLNLLETSLQNPIDSSSDSDQGPSASHPSLYKLPAHPFSQLLKIQEELKDVKELDDSKTPTVSNAVSSMLKTADLMKQSLIKSKLEMLNTIKSSLTKGSTGQGETKAKEQIASSSESGGKSPFSEEDKDDDENYETVSEQDIESKHSQEESSGYETISEESLELSKNKQHKKKIANYYGAKNKKKVLVAPKHQKKHNKSESSSSGSSSSGPSAHSKKMQHKVSNDAPGLGNEYGDETGKDEAMSSGADDDGSEDSYQSAGSSSQQEGSSGSEDGEDSEGSGEEDEHTDSDESSFATESAATINSQEAKQEYETEMDSEIPENLARDVIKTFKVVQAAVEKTFRDTKDENFIENALSLPLPKAYSVLLQDLRFDYMDIRDSNDTTGQHYKHHYASIAAQNQNPPASKMVRLAQELADLSNALPYEHTNAIFVRVDTQRVDLMKALICGASNTPYAHGCFEYDIFCDNNYPREPPKMNLITTGNGAVRFNPNLYACGKVCLSLLGTWRGSATENWDPKLSTILQVLLSTQAIIMSEEVYFNEPGFENEAGTPEGEKKNEGYSNIVRYNNIKFAMIEQIKRPPKGFESVIKRHYYIKKAEIMKEVNHWIELADTNEATYGALVNDHNYNWANQFKQTKTKYKEMLVAAVKQLEEELNKLERPSDHELKLQADMKRKVGQKKKKRQSITEGKIELGNIDVEYDADEVTQINTDSKKDIDVEDEAVKDRWSRYIGAMGVEAVAKQAASKIFMSGAGALGAEIAKNIVLSGCKQFTLHDTKQITYRDLSGQFFLSLEEDLLNEKRKSITRAEACLPRLQQLNFYVKCRLAVSEPIPLDEALLEKEPWNFEQYDLIILTEASSEEIIFLNEYCRKRDKKFLVADTYGVFARVFNDFGDKFEILDKNGEDLQDVMIKSISNEEQGVVELLPNLKHKFEDGDEVLITQVEGMKLREGEKHDDEQIKSDSINETIHKVTVLTPYSFKIGDTRRFDSYGRNGIAKQLKTKKVMKCRSFQECMVKGMAELPLDQNLSVADFEKMSHHVLTHIAFEALDVFKKQNKRMPGVWDRKDAELFISYATEIAPRYDIKPEDLKLDSAELKFFYLFSFTCQGVLNPLSAFIGGFAAQEAIKAITQKFSPIQQVFYYDALEVLPDFDPTKDFSNNENEEEKAGNYFQDTYVTEIAKVKEIGHRSDGLRLIVGQDIIDKLAYTRLFMVGAGAIGCELLKNYAMLGVGVGKANSKKKTTSGSIVLTDPDIIEVSNLNRQFLFREKHLRKPKSSTAAAAAIQMNKELKENIIARLDKIHEGTSNIYTDQFFEDLTVVTNALDNVQARRYIDSRCVVAKTPLLESGTLGPKGHVQVVLPFKTESYGSMNDPEDNTEVPFCTLKMFPEETLHCVEWARDKFGNLFTQAPKNVSKIIEEGENYQPTSQSDTQQLKQSVKTLKKRPLNFDQCIEYARLRFEKFFNHDIRQLLHVYPLDTKAKDGTLFWTLPKRPPVPIVYDQTNPLHYQLIASMACLRAVIFKISIPSETPRSEEFRKEVGAIAAQIKVPDFVPNDEKAKEIQASVNKESKKQDEEEEKGSEAEEKLPAEEEQKFDTNDVEYLTKEFRELLKSLPNQDKLAETMRAEEFEKDNDANFHIDFIYALANCRAINYKLDPMDWLTVKIKAGRIVPALATTTAAIAGLQTLELVKLLKGCKKTDHRNIFLNLAVPIMQASEPGDLIKTKLTENIEVSLWDRWDVKKGKNVKLKEVIKYLEETYSGLEVRDVMRGNAPIYFSAIMNAPGKEQEKQRVLNETVAELVGADSDDRYVDLTLTFIAKSDIEEKILSGVPPVRVYLEQLNEK